MIFGFVFLLSNLVSFSQVSDLRTLDYSAPDSIALMHSKQKYKTTLELTRKLTRTLTADHDKFRVFFRWITENVKYKWGAYGTNPNKVVTSKKAVCEGYASLLYEMCMLVGIECRIINGYAKSFPENLYTNMKETNHAWNAVKLYGKWYLIDATWASGGYDPKKRKFTKEYDETYFLTDPAFFALRHFPIDEQWNLTDSTFSKQEFKKSPIFYTNYHYMGIRLVEPIKGKVGNSMNIKFISDEPINRASLALDNDTDKNGNREFKTLAITKMDKTYTISYEFEKDDEGALAIYMNGKAILGLLKK